MRHFQNLRSLRIQADGKVWVYDHHTEKELRFKLAPMGGHAGTGNYLKQWRKRKKLTQTDAARDLGLSQSMIARIESGSRAMPLAVFETIRLEIFRNYGRR